MSATPAFIRSLYIGNNIGNVMYGVELVLYFKTIHVLLGSKRRPMQLFYALFSTVMLFLITVWVTAQVLFGEKMWLSHANYPGGALAYWKANTDLWYMDLAAVTVMALQLMTDGLMIYRCRMAWNSYWAVIVPIILWVATLVLGAVVAWLTSSPGVDFYTGIASRFSLAYWSVSVFLHTTLSCMVCYHLLRHGKRVQEYLGREHASFYFAIVSTVVESVLPYTLSGIAFIVALGLGSSATAGLIRVYFLMMCISPQMLILRVVSGKAWRNDIVDLPANSSIIQFRPGHVSELGPEWIDSGGGEVYALASLDRDPRGDVRKSRV